MALTWKQLDEKYDPSAKYVTRRPFLYAGVQYSPGDPFDTEQDHRRSRILLERRFLVKAGNEAGNKIRDIPVRRTADGKRRVVKRSPGWYDVLDEDGNKLNERAIRKKDAETLAKRTSA